MRVGRRFENKPTFSQAEGAHLSGAELGQDRDRGSERCKREESRGVSTGTGLWDRD